MLGPVQELRTTRQAAEELDVDPSTITRMVLDGRLPVAFKGPGATGALFFKPTDVAKLAKARAADAEQVAS